MGREFERKYAATPMILAEIAAQYPNARRIGMESTYYDTPSGDFSARHITLRLRRENGKCVCTIKTPLPDGGRGEWECTAQTIADGIASLVECGAPREILDLSKNGLTAVCGARFTRLAVDLPTADGTAELALDSGRLYGGGREIPLCEVELEKKSGSDAATAALAKAFAAQYCLKSEEKSKFRRAADLAQGV